MIIKLASTWHSCNWLITIQGIPHINSLVKRLYFRNIPTILCDGAFFISTQVLLRSLATHQILNAKQIST
jgi:hypothetical protein